MRTQSPIGLAPPAPLPNETTRVTRAPQLAPCVSRSRVYRFALDASGRPIELGSGRFAKAYLGEERWLESKTVFRRDVAIKLLQKGVSVEDQLRFQMEKELLERVQGHPNIVELFASGEADNPEFIPAAIRDRVENDFMILERSTCRSRSASRARASAGCATIFSPIRCASGSSACSST